MDSDSLLLSVLENVDCVNIYELALLAFVSHFLFLHFSQLYIYQWIKLIFTFGKTDQSLNNKIVSLYRVGKIGYKL